MRNRILQIVRSTIPYAKELNALTGSVTSSLLMQQLDYWFSVAGDGFYKFIAPPTDREGKLHPRYQKGDSWTEELGFTVDEFRGAFDRIGVRHSSKTYFVSAVNPFRTKEGHEKFYCSYHDRQTGLTHYYRNHPKLDNALDSIVVNPDPYRSYAGSETRVSGNGENPIYGNREIPRYRNGEKSSYGNEGFPSSVTGKSPVTVLIGPETTAETTYSETTSQKSTAAAAASAPAKNEKAAAAAVDAETKKKIQILRDRYVMERDALTLVSFSLEDIKRAVDAYDSDIANGGKIRYPFKWIEKALKEGFARVDPQQQASDAARRILKHRQERKLENSLTPDQKTGRKVVRESSPEILAEIVGKLREKYHGNAAALERMAAKQPEENPDLWTAIGRNRQFLGIE